MPATSGGDEPTTSEAVAPEQPSEVASGAQLTAADLLPKEEPELGEVKEEPAEEVAPQAVEEEAAEAEEVVEEEAAEEEEVEVEAEPEAPPEEAIKEEAPDDTEGAADLDIAEPGEGAEAGESDPIDVDEDAVHSSPLAEVVSVHSPASPELSERAISEPPERPAREGRLRVRPRILKPPGSLPEGTYPTVRIDRQGIWVLVSPAPAPPTSGVRDAEVLPKAPAPSTEGAAAADIDPYELPQAVWQDLALAFAARPPSLDLAAAQVLSDRQGERTEEGFRLGVGAFRSGEVVEARSVSPARSRSPRQPKAEGAAPSAPSRVTTAPAPPKTASAPKPPPVVPIAASSSTPLPPPPPSVPLPPPARPPPQAPTAAKGPPAKEPPEPPPQWAKDQAQRRREEAEAAKAKATEAEAKASSEAWLGPDQGAQASGAAARSRSPVAPPRKAPPPHLLITKPAPRVQFKPPPTAGLQAAQEREQIAKAKAAIREVEAQQRREEAAAKPSVPSAPRQVGLRPTLCVVFDWHKTLDLGVDQHGNWSERVANTLGQIYRTHRPIVFRILSFTGHGQAQAHRQEAADKLPQLERAAGITFASYDQVFERTGRGGKAELLHSLGPVKGQPPGAHYLVDDNTAIVKESRRTGCRAILVTKPNGRRYYSEQDLVDALGALNESLHALPEDRATVTGAEVLQQSQYLEYIYR